MGASGAIELAACLMMMRDSVIYPTRNLEQPAEDCAKLQHIQQLTSANVNCFIKNSFAFGGINAVLVCKKFNLEAKLFFPASYNTVNPLNNDNINNNYQVSIKWIKVKLEIRSNRF